jgi:hypothetical protein
LAGNLRQRSGQGVWSSGSKDRKDMYAHFGSGGSKESADASCESSESERAARALGAYVNLGPDSSGSGKGRGQSSNPSSSKMSGDTLLGGNEQGWGWSKADAYVDVWLITEFCRLGTLSQAIYDGLLDTAQSALPDMVSVVLESTVVQGVRYTAIVEKAMSHELSLGSHHCVRLWDGNTGIVEKAMSHELSLGSHHCVCVFGMVICQLHVPSWKESACCKPCCYNRDLNNMVTLHCISCLSLTGSSHVSS